MKKLDQLKNSKRASDKLKKILVLMLIINMAFGTNGLSVFASGINNGTPAQQATQGEQKDVQTGDDSVKTEQTEKSGSENEAKKDTPDNSDQNTVEKEKSDSNISDKKDGNDKIVEDKNESENKTTAITEIENDNKIQVENNKDVISVGIKLRSNEDLTDIKNSISVETDTDRIKTINDALDSQEKTEYDVLLPLDILCQKNAADYTFKEPITVELTINEEETLTDSLLYHQKKDGTFEKIDFKYSFDKEKKEETIEFKTDSFSPFLFVKEIEKAETDKANDTDETKTDENNENKSDAGEGPITSKSKKNNLLKNSGGPSVIINVENQNGGEITDADLGDGFDLIYYEYPQTGAYPYDDNYKRTIHISSVTTEVPLTMESDASASTPYTIEFIGDDMGSGYTPYSAKSKYVSASRLTYDGTNITSALDKNGQPINIDNNSVEITAYKMTMVSPRFRVKFNNEDATNYPVTLHGAISKIPMYPYSPTPVANDAIMETFDQVITGPGEYTIQLTGEYNDMFGEAMPGINVMTMIEPASGSTAHWTPVNIMGVVNTGNMGGNEVVASLTTAKHDGKLYSFNFNGQQPSIMNEEYLLQYDLKENGIILNINVFDEDGNLLTDADIPDGGIDLPITGNLSSGGDDLDTVLHITHAQETITDYQNFDKGTADNPYYLNIHDSNDNYLKAEYIAATSITYNGTIITRAYQQRNNISVLNNNVVNVNVYKMNMFKPHIKVKFSSNGKAVYPSSVNGYIAPINAPQSAAYDTFSGAVTEDGICDIEIDSYYNDNFKNPSTGLMVTINPMCTNENYEWKWDNAPQSAFMVNEQTRRLCGSLQSDGFYVTEINQQTSTIQNQDEPYIFELRAKGSNIVEPNIKIRFTDVDNLSGDEDWPIYMKVKLSNPPSVQSVHSSNLDDTGNGPDGYGNNNNVANVVTVPGASQVKVTITCQTESTNWDWACVWAGNHPDYRASSNYSSSVSGKLGGTNKTTHTYTIAGDSATIGFYSDSIIDGYYGYYATVEGLDANGNSMNGEGNEPFYEDIIQVNRDDLGNFIQLNIPDIPKVSNYTLEVDPCKDSEGTQTNQWWAKKTTQISSTQIENYSETHPYLKKALNFTIKTKTNVDDVYPLYVKARVEKGGAVENEKVVRIDNDGTTSVKMTVSKPTGYESIGERTIHFAAYKDEACTEPFDEWSCYDDTINIGCNYNNNFVTYDESGNETTNINYNMSVIGTRDISVPVNINILDENIAGQILPITMVATLDNGVNQYVETVPITSMADIPTQITFTNETGIFSNRDTYSISCKFYNGTNTEAENFYAPSNQSQYIFTKNSDQLVLTENNKLFTAHGTSNAYGITYTQVGLKVKPEPYQETVDSENPIYISTTIIDNSDYSNPKTYQKTVQRTNADEFTLITPVFAVPSNTLGNDYTHLGIQSYVQKTENNNEPKETWNEDNTEGCLGVDGMIKTDSTLTVNTVARPYELSNVNKVPVAITVHANVPNDVEKPFMLKEQGANEAIHAMMFKKDIDGSYKPVSNNQYTDYYNNYNNGWSGDSYCYSSIDNLDGDNNININVGQHTPGTYYLLWYIGTDSSYISTSDGSINNYVDVQWKQNIYNFTEIKVLDDGSVVDAENNPFIAQLEFDSVSPELAAEKVAVTIDVQTTLPDNYDYQMAVGNSNNDTPYAYQVSLTPQWDNSSYKYSFDRYINFRAGKTRNTYSGYNYKTQIIPNGHSQIGSSAATYDWLSYLYDKDEESNGNYDISDFTGTPTIATIISGWSGSSTYYNSFYRGNPSIEKYDVDEGFPVGDYTLSYYAPDVSGWYSDEVTVHLSEDGKLYKKLGDNEYDTTPYTVEFRKATSDELQGDVIESVPSINVTASTYAHDGIDLSALFEKSNEIQCEFFEYNVATHEENVIATGSMAITEEGIVEFPLLPTEGSTIDIRTNNTYYIRYQTTTDNEVNFDFPVQRYGAEYNPQQLVELNNNILINNEYLVLPWEETTPQKVVRNENAENTLSFKPVTSTGQLKEKANYIIAVVNPSDGCLYALAYDEAGGHQVKLADAEEYQAMLAGGELEYKVAETDDISNYVWQSNKLKLAEGSASLQFKAGTKVNGKNIAVKLGSSSSNLEPLLDISAGTVNVKENNGEFELWKGTYARIEYTPELFGYSGFDVQGYYTGTHGNYPREYPYVSMDYDTNLPNMIHKRFVQDNKPYTGYTMSGINTPYSNDVYLSLDSSLIDKPEGSWTNYYRWNIDEQYKTNDYLQSFASQYDQSNPVITKFIILSDNVQEDVPPEITNQYTLIKTGGDFIKTFIEQASAQTTMGANMVFVYTDDDGKEWVLGPNGLKETKSELTSNDYRKINVGAENELIPNNNSGTSERFSFYMADVEGTLETVFASDFAFRKSRLNQNTNIDYLTLNGDENSAWTRNDDNRSSDSIIYVLEPSSKIRSISDYDTPQEYKLSAIRNGETRYLGITEDGSGKKQLTYVTDKNDAVSFKIYSDKINRFYSSAYGSDLYRYYKIESLEDINAMDEIIIVYNDNGTKKIVSRAHVDSGHIIGSMNSGNDSMSSAVQVLDEYSDVDVRDSEYPENAAYKYRFDTEEYTKKPFAYVDSQENNIIWAQGITANAIGEAKSETNKQRKYASVKALADNTDFYIKAERSNLDLYYSKSAETNFFKSDVPGEFYIRGGKSDAWLGAGEYTKQYLRLDDGTWHPSDTKTFFTTVGTDNRLSFEIYKRSATTETFTVEYHKVDGSVDKSETKPRESFVLTQKMDAQNDGKDYIFVGWTTDPEKAGYLSLEDSTNLYDYDDVANKASIKQSTSNKYSLLGACSPDGNNRIAFESVENLLDDSGTLKVYPIYAIKGYSSAISANDGDKMIIGASDFKDLQMSGNGQINTAERWLGSINIEVYKDGELWVPGAGGTTIGKKNRNTTPETATLYFAYHNDNAADLNIKFIADEVTADTLYDYMSSDDFSQTEPSANYLIDAVWAEQGGSEDGLKYRYNWMSSENGGQLDNVKGGSTVKIYLTTKYQVKYYLDKNDGNGYQQLTDAKWANENYYTTPGTENAVTELRTNNTDYFIEHDGDEYQNLIDKTPSMTTTFIDEAISRGEYSQFLYKFDDYNHVIPIAELPTEKLNTGQELENAYWEIKNSEMMNVSTANPSSDMPVTGTSYGTGNTIYSYNGASDNTNTFHLYAKTKKDMGTLSVSKMVKGNLGDISKEWEFTGVITSTDEKVPSEIDYIKNGQSGKLNVTGTNREGHITFHLKTREQIDMELPTGVTVTIVETDANNRYVTTVEASSSEGSPTILADNSGATLTVADSNTIAFTNTRNFMSVTNRNGPWIPLPLLLIPVMGIIAIMLKRKYKRKFEL